jgi:hypothetical protein
MKRLMMWVLLPVLAVVVIGSMTPVHAIPAFEAEYKKTYYKPDGSAEQKKLAAAIDKISETKDGKTTSCNVCHIAGQGKKMKNEYGQAVGKVVTKKDKDAADKIQAGLKTTEGEKSKSGKTFGDLIKAGELPQ